MERYAFISFPYLKIHLSFLEVGKKEGNTMICLGKEPNTYMSDPSESFEELSYVSISKSNEKTKFLNWLMQGDLNPCYSIIQLPKIMW